MLDGDGLLVLSELMAGLDRRRHLDLVRVVVDALEARHVRVRRHRAPSVVVELRRRRLVLLLLVRSDDDVAVLGRDLNLD